MVTTGIGQTLENGTSPDTWSRCLQWVRDYPGGAALSERFKSAFRVALAMVITYGISLAMDWDKTFWAALSVIFCSLVTSGESINRGIDRVLGTTVAAILVLLVIALFPQDRWLFLISLSGIIAVCGYHMAARSPRWALWFNAGFNLPIISILAESGGDLAPATFEMAILRVQQTGLGVIVYSLVAVLVWPRRGDEDFVATVRGVCSKQGQLFSGYIDVLLGKTNADELYKPMAEVAAQLPALGGKLEGAVYDRPEMRPMARVWSSHIQTVRALHVAFDRWIAGFDQLAGLELKHYIDGWDAFVEDVEARFRGVDALLSGQPFEYRSAAQELSLNEDALEGLSHFRRATVMSFRDRLLTIAGLASALLDSAGRISRQETGETGVDIHPLAAEPWSIDLDRLHATVRQTTALWLSILAVIYIEGVPIAVALVSLTNGFAMGLGLLPQAPATMMYKPVLQGGLFAGAVYMCVMPHLSGFLALGGLLFAAIFIVAYIFHAPRAILVRGIWMTMLVLIMGADNQQIYSFVAFADWLTVGVLYVTILAIAWRFPISFRPEDQLESQLRRFLESAAFMLRDLSVGDDASWLDRQRRAFHARQLNALPSRLKVWASVLSPAAIDEDARMQLLASLRAFQIFSYRIQDLRAVLADARRIQGIDHSRKRARELRDVMASLIEYLAKDPEMSRRADLLESLALAQVDLRQQVEDQLDAAELSRGESAVVYSLLVACGGLRSAFNSSLKGLSELDWKRLREPRF